MASKFQLRHFYDWKCDPLWSATLGLRALVRSGGCLFALAAQPRKPKSVATGDRGHGGQRGPRRT